MYSYSIVPQNEILMHVFPTTWKQACQLLSSTFSTFIIWSSLFLSLFCHIFSKHYASVRWRCFSGQFDPVGLLLFWFLVFSPFVKENRNIVVGFKVICLIQCYMVSKFIILLIFCSGSPYQGEDSAAKVVEATRKETKGPSHSSRGWTSACWPIQRTGNIFFGR